MEYRDYYNGQAITVGDYLTLFSLSKSKINILLNNNCVYVNDLPAKIDTIIYRNDDIRIDYEIIDDIENLDTKNITISQELNVLFEDAYIMIVDKPANMLIYDLNNQQNVTLDVLVAKYYIENGIDTKVRHVHRLDKETTGCVVYAKDPLTHSSLSKMVEDNTLIREYIGICEGNFENESGEIEANIGRDRHNAKKMIVSKTGKFALTKYFVIKNNHKWCVVKFILKTGRTHQIRVHTSYLNHPLIGDTLYNKKVYNNKRCLLHSSCVKFQHPVTNKEIVVNSDLPKDMLGYL